MSTRFVGEVLGYAKQGAAFGYTASRGYHPILATRADTGEVLHIRLRKGSANTSRGARRFLDELLARVERAGASGPRLLRADRGFWNKQIFERLDAGGLAILDRRAPATGGPSGDRGDRRERLADSARLPEDLDRADRRDHAGRPAADRPPRPHPRSPGPTAAELGAVSVPHQPQRGRSHVSRPSTASTPSSSSRSATSKTRRSRTFPPGSFSANAAWTVIAALAHNLLRWTGVLGLPGRTVRAARTLRRRCSRSPAA